MRFIIKDWAGNTYFNDKEFLSFEEAADFLTHSVEETEIQEYFIEEK